MVKHNSKSQRRQQKIEQSIVCGAELRELICKLILISFIAIWYKHNNEPRDSL
jgi:hypothetical protein